MGFKFVVSDPKSRKAYQKEVESPDLIGKKIGDNLPAGFLGMEGYSIQITGGSDKEGFPMRGDIEGSGRKKILLSHPPGFHPNRKGQRMRKSVRGNTISENTVQINAKVIEYGKKSLEELLGAKKEEKKDSADKPKETQAPKKEEKPEATEKKESKEEVKTDSKPEEKKEEVKEEPKKEEKDDKKEAPPEKDPGQEKAEEKMGVKKLE